MAAIDDDGAWPAWIGWLGRRLGGGGGAGDAVTPAARPAGDLVRSSPEVLLLEAVISGMPDPVVVLD
ncbi:MAG: hypothetical protein WEA28_08265, partial [Xanthobacteraceae bacterium]